MSASAASVSEGRASFLHFPAVFLQCSQDLGPLLVPTLHLDRSNGGKDLFCGQVLGQPGQELGYVDEVHLGQDVLEQLQDAQGRAEEELFPISTEHIPDSTGQVQGQRFTVQGKDPIN